MYCTALINVRKSAYDLIRNIFNLNHHDASLLAVSGPPPPGHNNASLESRAVCKQERKKERKEKQKQKEHKRKKLSQNTITSRRL